MAEYVYIDNLAKKGTIGISNLVFESIVCDAIDKIPGITESSKRLKRNQKIRLNRPVRTYIRSGVVHIWLAVDVKNGIDEKETVSLLEKEEDDENEIENLVANIYTTYKKTLADIKIEKTQAIKSTTKNFTREQIVHEI